MYFDHLSPHLFTAANTTILASITPLPIKPLLIVSPEKDKTTISVDQIREVIKLCQTKQTTPQFIVITPADQLHPSAANALLKILEEPKPNYHFILLTEYPYLLLPTILTRSRLYFPKIAHPLDQPPATTPKNLAFAKSLLVVTKTDLPTLADKISQQKRPGALIILSTTIELAYKSYFKTNNPAFLKKLPAFLKIYQNITKNGHIKLQIVANLC